MWYLVKDVCCDMFSVRYYEYEHQLPTIMLGINNNSYWAEDVTSLTNLYTHKDIAFMTIDEMVFDTSYHIIPLPDMSTDITSIVSILEAYPELFI